MKPEIQYAVFTNQKEQAVGHFLNGKYYEPFGSDRQLGHLDTNDNFVYYVVTSENPKPRIHGRVEGDILIREKDGLRFQIQPAEQG